VDTLVDLILIAVGTDKKEEL